MIYALVFTSIMIIFLVVKLTIWLTKKDKSINKSIDVLRKECFHIETENDYIKCLNDYNHLKNSAFHKSHFHQLETIYNVILFKKSIILEEEKYA